MKVVVDHPNGRREEFSTAGENFSLGLGAQKLTCVCGQSRFVEGGNPKSPEEREPDFVCECSRKFWLYEDEGEQVGYLH